VVEADDSDPSALLLAGWLSSRLGIYVPVENTPSGEISRVTIGFGDDTSICALRDSGRLVLRREGQQDSIAPFPERSLGELLAEELRRLDDDHTFADALGTVTGISGLEDRPDQRVHIWNDPALADGSTAGAAS
jgi:glucose-6-phosphate dehydrogenase assembly protein OpcA